MTTPTPKPRRVKKSPKPRRAKVKHLYLVGYNTKGRPQCVYGAPVNVPVSFTHRMTLNQAKRYAAREMQSHDTPVSVFELVPVITGYVRNGVFTPLPRSRK